MTEDGIKRRLAAIFSADATNYSRLMHEDEMATIETITTYRKMIFELVFQHHGRVVDSPGDNILAEFVSVVDAVQSATAIQKELKTRNAKLPKSRRMAFRIGINLGDIIADGDRIYGDGVNIAARLEGLADPGGICISRTAYDQIEDKLPLAYEYLGEKTVKNLAKPIPAYKVFIEPRRFSGKKAWQWSREQARSFAQCDMSPAGKNGEKGSIPSKISSKKRMIAFALCLCFGVFGIHRFYVGKTTSAKVQLFTIGGLGLWFLTDLILILVGEFSDGHGRKIRAWI